MNDSSCDGRIGALERRCRVLTRMLGLALTLSLGSVLIAATAQSGVVEAREFRVLGDEGETVASLTAAAGGARLVLSRRGGGDVTLMADDQTNGLRLRDESGRDVAWFDVRENGPGIRFGDRNQTTRLFIGVGERERGSPILMLWDVAGERTAEFSAPASGPNLVLYDARGAKRVGLFVGPDGPGLGVTSIDGRTIWQAPPSR